ncbi:unnamed protein product [Alopecurus aequalis]
MAAQEASQPLGWRYGNVDDGNFNVRGLPVLAALLAILVCFVGVCIYLRWACRRYNPNPTLPSYSSSSSSGAAPGAASSVVGLDAAAVASLPVTLYRRPPVGEDVDEAQCSICLGEFAEGEQVKALPRCGHCFHPECVDAWLRSRPSCPLCRGSLLAGTTNPTDAGSEAV